MIFRQKKIKKKRKNIPSLKNNNFLGGFCSTITTPLTYHPKQHVSSRIIVPQNRSFQASLSGHPPRRRKLLLRWTPIASTLKSFTRVKNTKKNCIKHQNCIKELLPKTENQFSSCVLSQEEVDLQEYHIGAKDLVTP